MSSIENLHKNEALTDHLVTDVVVIGAGVSGLSAAHELKKNGSDVVVFEKARGTGGRLGSKRINLENALNSSTGLTISKDTELNASFDLGASTFSARSPDFQQYLKALTMQGVVAKVEDKLDEYVAMPRNSILTRHMSKDLDVSFSTKITRIEKSNGQWLIYGEAQANRRQPQVTVVDANKEQPHERLLCCCQHLILSAPAEQVSLLLPNDHAGMSWIRNIHSDPVFVSTFIFPSNALTRDNLKKLRLFSNGVISNLSIEHTKPNRQEDGYQIIKLTTTVEWTQVHLNDEPTGVSENLLIEFNNLLVALDIDGVTMIQQYTHRWLYCQYSNLIKSTKGYLSFSDNLHVVGDYFDIEPEISLDSNVKVEGVERAYLSAQRLVSHLLQGPLTGRYDEATSVRDNLSQGSI